MKLNDPFGRMARRREREYQSLCQSLKQAGLNDPGKAEQLISSLRKRTKSILWVAAPATVVLALAFREYAVYVLALGALTMLWLINTTRRGTEYISRYIEEECSRGPGTDSLLDERPDESRAPDDGGSTRTDDDSKPD